MKISKIIFVVVLLLSIVGCQKPKLHQCIYAFDNTEEATQENIRKVISVLDKRLTVYGLKHTIEAYQEVNIKITVESHAEILNVKSLSNVVSNKGKFEFWETFEAEKISANLFDFEGLISNDSNKEENTSNSILKSAIAIGYPGAPILFYIKPRDTLNVIKTLDSLKQDLTGNQKFVKFLYGKPGNDGSLPIYTIKSNRQDKAVISGNVVEEVSQNYNNKSVVNFVMNKVGAVEWERLTGKA
ncbi:MAG: hypothetical protein QNK89_02225 [Lacinutrix sp.]|uniref:hypothetical protein n=1 Tax=Lacinutrix sp. TaxID=1937692 RepID=UPI0030A0B9D3